MVDGEAQQFLLHALHERGEIAPGAVDDPVCHRLPGDVHPVTPEFLLDPVERCGIHIFYIQDGGKEGRGHDAVREDIFRTVPTQEFILVVTACPDIDLYGMDFDRP